MQAVRAGASQDSVFLTATALGKYTAPEAAVCLGRLASMLLLQVWPLGPLHRGFDHGQHEACIRYQVQGQPPKPSLFLEQTCISSIAAVWLGRLASMLLL